MIYKKLISRKADITQDDFYALMKENVFTEEFKKIFEKINKEYVDGDKSSNKIKLSPEVFMFWLNDLFKDEDKDYVLSYQDFKNLKECKKTDPIAYMEYLNVSKSIIDFNERKKEDLDSMTLIELLGYDGYLRFAFDENVMITPFIVTEENSNTGVSFSIKDNLYYCDFEIISMGIILINQCENDETRFKFYGVNFK